MRWPVRTGEVFAGACLEAAVQEVFGAEAQNRVAGRREGIERDREALILRAVRRSGPCIREERAGLYDGDVGTGVGHVMCMVSPIV